MRALGSTPAHAIKIVQINVDEDRYNFEYINIEQLPTPAYFSDTNSTLNNYH